MNTHGYCKNKLKAAAAAFVIAMGTLCASTGAAQVPQFYIVNKASGGTLTAPVPPGIEVQNLPLVANNPLQLWEIYFIGDGYYKIFNRATGRFLAAHAGLHKAPVHMTTGVLNERYDSWRIIQLPNPAVYPFEFLIDTPWPGLTMDAQGGKTGRVHLYKFNQSAAQTWSLRMR